MIANLAPLMYTLTRMTKVFLGGVPLLLSSLGYGQDLTIYQSDSITVGTYWSEGDSATITFTHVNGYWKYVQIAYSNAAEDDFIVIREPVNLAWNCEEYSGLTNGKVIYLGICGEGKDLGEKLFFINPTSTEYKDALVFHGLRVVNGE